LESLENRILLTKTHPADPGDFYWYFDEKTPLTRATDQIVVGFYPGSAKRIRRLAAAITSDTGPLVGYTVQRSLTPTSFLLKKTSAGDPPSFKKLLRRTNGFRALKYVSPTFFTADSPSRISVTDEIEVDLRDDVDPESFFRKGFSGYTPASGTNDYVATLAKGGGIDTLRLAARLHDHPKVDHAGANFFFDVIPSAFAATDQYYASQWNLVTSHVNDALEDETGNPDVLIAILDNGVQFDDTDITQGQSTHHTGHPDLQAGIYTNPEDPLGGGDNDNNRVNTLSGNMADDLHGWDFITNDNNPNPEGGDNHGTVVAGIAAARANNGAQNTEGIVGAAPNVRILPVRMVGPDLAANVLQVRDAIYYAAGLDGSGNPVWRGADVLSCSWGCARDDRVTTAFQMASRHGRNGHGTPIFMASGNGNGNVQYPAYLATPSRLYPTGTVHRDTIVAVGAIARGDPPDATKLRRASYSSFGADLTLVAPSGERPDHSNDARGIYSTDRTSTDGYNANRGNNNYVAGWFSGTSAATPLVAGVAALMIARDPNQDGDLIKTRLEQTAIRTGLYERDLTTLANFPNGVNPGLGHGLLDADAALGMVDEDTTAPTVTSSVLSGDDGTSQTDSQSPTLDFNFSERTVGKMSDIQVSGPGSVSFTAHGFGTTRLRVRFNNLTKGGTYTVTLLGGANHFHDQGQNNLASAGYTRTFSVEPPLPSSPPTPQSVVLDPNDDTFNAKAGTDDDNATRKPRPTIKITLGGAPQANQVHLTITAHGNKNQVVFETNDPQTPGTPFAANAVVSVPVTSDLPDGTYDVYGRAMNDAGTSQDEMMDDPLVIKAKPPGVVGITAVLTAVDGSPLLHGRVPRAPDGSQSKAEVRLIRNGVTQVNTNVTVSPSGFWEFKDSGASRRKNNKYQAYYINDVGVRSPNSGRKTWRHDGTQTPKSMARRALAIRGVGDDAPEKGNQAKTTDQTLVLHGFGEPGSTVSLRRNDQPVGSVEIDDSGQWTIDTSSTSLPAGDYTFVASTAEAGVTYGETSSLVVHVGAEEVIPSGIRYIVAGGAAVYSGQATAESNWTLVGYGEPGTFVRVQDNHYGISDIAAVDAEGNWSTTFSAFSYNEQPEDLQINQVSEDGSTYAPEYGPLFRVYYDPWAPTVVDVQASPDPAGNGIDRIYLNFSEPVLGLSLEDFTLTRDDVVVPWDGQTLDGSDPENWVIDGLGTLTATPGLYVLSRDDGGAGITDAVGNPMTAAFPDLRFAIANGTSGADTFRLSPSTGGTAVDVILNNVTLFSTTATQIFLNGADGNDVLIDQLPATLKPAGGVFWRGGAGSDQLQVNPPGTTSNDEIDVDAALVSLTLNGSTVDDEYDGVESVVINSGGGDDTLTIDLPVATTSVNAGDGADVITAAARTVTINGGAGNDTITGSSLGDLIFGGAGADSVDAAAGNDTVYGDAGNDTLHGQAGNDLLYGGAGDDSLGSTATSGDYMEAGADTLQGDDGNDILAAGPGNDLLYGDAGSVGHDSAGGNDAIYGGDGADTAYGNGGADTVEGGAGNDLAYGDFASVGYGYGSGYGYGEEIYESNDTLRGQDGDDTLYGDSYGVAWGFGFGNDSISGGAGNDLLYGENANAEGYGYGEYVYGDDALQGDDGNDTLNGGGGNDTLNGGAGNDYLSGGGSDDVFLAGDGSVDTLFGGEGNDSAILGSGRDENDVLGDEIENLY
jgi:hypothetical protein